MLSSPAGARRDARADETHARLERRLRRFAAPVQPTVRALAQRDPRIADLALSFPALLFALAMRRDADAACALAAVVEGCPLAEAAALAGVPLWLRKLPVDTLTAPLPFLPDGDLFRRRIANHLPRTPRDVPLWLDLVSSAAARAHEPFAIWIARELTRRRKDVKPKSLKLMSLWAWFSVNDGTIGRDMIEKRWHPAMRFNLARAAAEEWRTRAELYVNLGEGPIADMWLQGGCVDGYEFIPLRSGDEIAAEAAAMKNCLNSYGVDLAHNWSRLWSVRTNGERAATLSVARYRASPFPVIAELSAKQNRDVPMDVWWAARTWLNQQDLRAIDVKVHRRDTIPLDAAAWRALWRPYWLAKRCFPEWLPLAPSRAALWDL